MKNFFLGLLHVMTVSTTLVGSSAPWYECEKNGGWKSEFLALKYFHHSELQRQWAWHLLGTYRFKGTERVLDFGCGDGKITAEVSHFIPQGSIVGVDLSPSMIDVARRYFPTSCYPNVSFKQTLDTHFSDACENENFDLIYSFSVLHIVRDPIEILSNLRSRLANEGILLLVVPCGSHPSLAQAGNEIYAKYDLTSPWTSNDKSCSVVNMQSEEGCVQCLKKAGFEPLSVAVLHTPTPFYNKQELVEWMIGTMCANWRVPLEIANSFFSDLIDRMAEIDPEFLDESGIYYMKFSRFEIVATTQNSECQS